MKKWGFALISIGCVLIASAPLTSQQTSMILSGLLVIVSGILLVVRRQSN